MLAALAQTYQTNSGGSGATIVIYLAVIIVEFVAFWKIFVKAGQPGWAGIIPIYNWWVMLKIVGRPGWWFILFLIPIVNIVILIIVYNDLSKSFGKTAGFTVGMIFLGFIFFPILGFGDARYLGPAASSGSMGGGGSVPPPPPPMPA
jgi:Family of unknown function (DUF5684)